MPLYTLKFQDYVQAADVQEYIIKLNRMNPGAHAEGTWEDPLAFQQVTASPWRSDP